MSAPRVQEGRYRHLPLSGLLPSQSQSEGTNGGFEVAYDGAVSVSPVMRKDRIGATLY